MATIYTIGHSTRPLEELVAALKAHSIRTLVDIRSFPVSRRLPHFNREALELELPKYGIAYVWMKELGGRRKKIRNDSPNTGLRNDSFRNYADYMLTEEFARGIDRLVQIADPPLCPGTMGNDEVALAAAPPAPARDSVAVSPDGMTCQAMRAGNVAIMCAERVYFQCHRMLVSDYLAAHGHTVLHIVDDQRTARPHKLMTQARLVEGKVIYQAEQLF